MALPALPTQAILPGGYHPRTSRWETSRPLASPRSGLVAPKLVWKGQPVSAPSATNAAPTTPRVVAEFGARCIRGGTRGLTVEMSDTKQERLLDVPGLRESLDKYCVMARTAKSEDQSGLSPTVLYWKGDPQRGEVKLLGPKRGNRVYNLLRGTWVSDRVPGLRTVEPFGTPPGKAAFALFLDSGVAHNGKEAVASFRYGRIVGGDEEDLLIEVEGVRYPAHASVVAPSTSASGDVDVSSAAHNLPPRSETALEQLLHLKRECGQDAFTTRVLNEALAAVRATGLTTEAAGGGARVSARLQASATALLGAARYLRGETGACTWSAGETSPPKSLETVAGQLQVLACRARVAELAGRPDILHSPDDETFVRDLLDLDERPGKEKELEEAVKSCLATLSKVQSTITSRLRAHGLAKEDHRVSDEDYSRVVGACSNTMGVAGEHGAMEQLATMAKSKSVDTKALKWALRHAAPGELSRACTLSAEALVKKIQSVACRKKYRSVLKALGEDRAESREETNPGLAREVVVRLESDPKAGSYFKDSELAACVIGDDKNINSKVEAKLRAASPELEDKDVVEQIAKTEARQRKAIMTEQAELKRVCESGPHGKASNALAEELSSRSLLGALLSKEGQVQLSALNEAVPAVQAYLDAAPSGESKEAWAHRRMCKEQVVKFEASVRRALCRIRLTERLKLPGTDTQLVQRWLYDKGRGLVAEGEESETDEVCVHTLDELGAKVRERASLTSTRTCPDAAAKKVVERFCAATAGLLLPVNFLDFLSILVYAALPSWPADVLTVREHWLKRRERTLGADGQARSCQEQEAIIKIHAPEIRGRMSSGRASLRQALAEVLTAVEEGLDLGALSKCACSSADVLSKPVRSSVTRATRWYWEAGSEILSAGHDDAAKLNAGRQAMVMSLLQTEVASVSWWGAAQLREPPPSPQDGILSQLWQSYLQQLFDGHLAPFRRRIWAAEGASRACRLAMVDSFFFVVVLDLVDITQSATTSQEEAVLEKASALTGRSTAPGDAATAALALATASGLAGALTGVGAGTGAAVALGTGVTALGALASHHLGASLYKKHFSAPSFAEQTAAHLPDTHRAPPPRSVLGETYKQVYNATFFRKKKAVNFLLLQLCSRAFDEATAMEKRAATDPGAGDLGAMAASRLGEWETLDGLDRYEVTALSPPSFFPQGPPDGLDPPAQCNKGIC